MPPEPWALHRAQAGIAETGAMIGRDASVTLMTVHGPLWDSIGGER